MQNIFASTCHVNHRLYYVLQPKSLCLRLVELKPRGRAGIIVCYFACSIRVVVPNFLRLESCFSINIYISRVNSVALLRPPQKTKQHNVNPYSRQEQKTGKVVKTITRFKDTARGGEFRKDGKLVVAGGDDGVVQVFDVNSRAILRTMKEHNQ